MASVEPGGIMGRIAISWSRERALTETQILEACTSLTCQCISYISTLDIICETIEALGT